MIRQSILFLAMLSVAGFSMAQDRVIWSGGVGLEERQAAPVEGTKLVFFVKSGSFLSDVNVTVTDMAGDQLVKTTSRGPWLILDLPDGRYSVRAELKDGEAQGALINVDADHREFGFMFNDH